MSEAYTGGCARGAIRYEIPGEPMVMADCQCRDCQRKSGTGHDHPRRSQPRMVFYGVRGHAWDRLDPALPKFDRMPPA
ncbi:MAG: hypothetical protein WCK95_05295 [Alphaproteobacteria bacterium]|jgi:hypothetical protein